MSEETDSIHTVLSGYNLDDLMRHAHQTARSKGWWDDHDLDDESVFSEKIALMHSELSESLESWREGQTGGLKQIILRRPDGGVQDVTMAASVHIDKDTKPDGALVELADVIIRILDVCGRFNMDIATAVALKMRYNETRPFRHGGKKA